MIAYSIVIEPSHSAPSQIERRHREELTWRRARRHRIKTAPIGELQALVVPSDYLPLARITKYQRSLTPSSFIRDAWLVGGSQQHVGRMVFARGRSLGVAQHANEMPYRQRRAVRHHFRRRLVLGPERAPASGPNTSSRHRPLSSD
jgi:hypothetical protein